MDPSVDTALISQCFGPEKSLCQAVTANMEVFDALQEFDRVSLLPDSPPAFRLKRPPTQNTGSRSFSFRIHDWGEATITVGDNGAMFMFGSLQPEGAPYKYIIESCGDGCNVYVWFTTA